MNEFDFLEEFTEIYESELEPEPEPEPEPVQTLEPETVLEVQTEIVYVIVSDETDEEETVETVEETVETEISEETEETISTTSDYLKEIYINSEITSEAVSYIFAIVVVGAVALICNFILKIFFNNDRWH